MGMIDTSTSESVRGFEGRKIGVIANRTLVKTAKGKLHMLLCPLGWAIDAFAYDANRAKFDQIVVMDTVNGIRYEAQADYFDAQREEINRGYGRQYLLRLAKWNVEHFTDVDDADEHDIDSMRFTHMVR